MRSALIFALCLLLGGCTLPLNELAGRILPTEIETAPRRELTNDEKNMILAALLTKIDRGKFFGIFYPRLIRTRRPDGLVNYCAFVALKDEYGVLWTKMASYMLLNFDSQRLLSVEPVSTQRAVKDFLLGEPTANTCDSYGYHAQIN